MSRHYMHFRPTDVLRDVSVVLREDQVDWLNGLTGCDLEHDSRSETLRRVIDLARDYIESSIADDMPLPEETFVPFNQPVPCSSVEIRQRHLSHRSESHIHP